MIRRSLLFIAFLALPPDTIPGLRLSGEQQYFVVVFYPLNALSAELHFRPNKLSGSMEKGCILRHIPATAIQEMILQNSARNTTVDLIFCRTRGSG